MIFRDLIPYLFDLDDLIHNQKLCASVPYEASALTDGLCMAKDQGCQHIQVDGDSDPNFLLIVFGVVLISTAWKIKLLLRDIQALSIT